MKGDPRKGQAMLLATLALGGAILGATTIAGLLILYQIRSTTDSENSAKAIFAADAGTEWALFDYYCQFAVPTPTCPPEEPLPGNPPGTLANGAAVNVTCYDATGVTTTTCSDPTTVSAIAIGTVASSTKRAFFVDLSQATATLP